MKRVIITRSDDNIKHMSDITHPIFKRFAKEWDADFVVFDHKPPVMTGDGNVHYRILKAKEYLDTYDRLLFLDTDMIINKDCPNIFDEVPEDSIGTIYEDKGSRVPKRRSVMQNIQKRYGDVGWISGYTNAGTFLISNQHKELFEPINGEYYLDWGSVDAHFAYQINKNNYKVHELEYKWNHMTMFSEPWNNHADRFKSHIIHYAGSGIFDRSCPNRIQQIKNDYKKIYG
jgi:lipopolysaccharide biosynthesis glycosyltransferase